MVQQITPTPIANIVTTDLNASGDTSACEFTDWYVHTQVINGMYKRVFVYDSTPTVGVNGVVSGAPTVAYNYLDVNYSVQVAEEKETASYCSGSYQPQQLRIISDSTVGGAGLSGTFTTSAVGYMRRKWNTTTDSEDLCNKNTNAIVGRMPGTYDTTFDTSATVGSVIAELLMNAEETCPAFIQNLVEY